MKEFSQFGLPNKRVLTILSSFSVKMFASIVAILSKRVCLWILKFAQWRRKWIVVSIPLLQLHIGSIEFWKLCLNLCSFRWLNMIKKRNENDKKVKKVLKISNFSFKKSVSVKFYYKLFVLARNVLCFKL